MNLRESARGQDCTLRLPLVCNFNPETTVLLHPNTHRAGKGAMRKAEDALGAFGCSCCHDAMEGRGVRPKHLTPEEIEIAFWHGHAETMRHWIAVGLVKAP